MFIRVVVHKKGWGGRKEKRVSVITNSKFMWFHCICKHTVEQNVKRVWSLYRDIVKLTAQFVARNGRQFLTNLMNREQRNYQFDFLRPQHSLFQYFTKLLEQYTKVSLWVPRIRRGKSLSLSHDLCAIVA
jgi:hypothetical protein